MPIGFYYSKRLQMRIDIIFSQNNLQMKQEQSMGNTRNIQQEGTWIENKDIEDIFVCPPKYRKCSSPFRIPKSLEELANTPLKQIRQEFDILDHLRPHTQLLDHRFRRYYMEFLHSKVQVPELGSNFHVHANELTSLVDGKKIAILGSAPDISREQTWEAIYYKNVKMVLMLCPLHCDYIGIQTDQYWPNQGKKLTSQFGSSKITVKTNKIINLKAEKSQAQQERMKKQTYNVKEILLDGPQGQKNIKHVHWDGWRDLGTPTNSQIQILNEILAMCSAHIDKEEMIWIHCFSGVGRTGTFTSLLQIKRHVDRNKHFSIFSVLQNIRKYRNSAVEMDQQYEFLYKYAKTFVITN